MLEVQNIPPFDIASHIVDYDTLEFLFQTILNRPVGYDGYKKAMRVPRTVKDWTRQLVDSREFYLLFVNKNRTRLQAELSNSTESQNKRADALRDAKVHLPLSPVALGDAKERLRVMLFGTCQVGQLTLFAPALGHTIQHRLTGSYQRDEIPKVTTQGVDAVLVRLTLRHILGDAVGGGLASSDMALARLRTAEEANALIERCGCLIDRKIEDFAASLKGVPVFVQAFFEPSFNYLGGLISPYNPTSPRAVVRRLNERLYATVASKENFYVLDVNDILNYVGRMHLHDDVITHSTHGSIMIDDNTEKERVAPSRRNSETFQIDRYLAVYTEVLLNTIKTNLAVIRNDRPVKLIIVDLDDTLWRGVAAEEGLSNGQRLEGWPIGLVEALLYFKKRGGLLAIASKNDRELTLNRLKGLFANAITPEDFASIKINWNPKSESIAEILNEVNILAQNTLFIDDNPREIYEVKRRFPGMRFLNDNHYDWPSGDDWRRIIMQAPETQVARITEESARRTEMVQARVERRELEQTISRGDWLKSLEVEQRMWILDLSDKSRFESSFELINKTNQFNTTGKRWELAEFKDFLTGGGICLLASLKDKTTDNGIIGATLIKDSEIVQAVLSCRVFGLGAETAMGAAATRIALSHASRAFGKIIDTGRKFHLP